MKRVVLTGCLMLFTLGLIAQQVGRNCDDYERQRKIYNAAIKEYSENKILWDDFLVISKKTRLSLNNCLISDRTQMTDQEYYTKQYSYGLLLMNEAYYDIASTLFKGIINDQKYTQKIAYLGKSVVRLSRVKLGECYKLKHDPEQGKYLYVTLWFRGKSSSYLSSILGDTLYKNELKYSLQQHPYFNFETDKLKAGIFKIKDSLAAKKYFLSNFANYNNDVDKEYVAAQQYYAPLLKRWDILKTELTDFKLRNPQDSGLLSVQIGNAENHFKENFSFLKSGLTFKQQFVSPLLFIPGPAYFDPFKSAFKDEKDRTFKRSNKFSFYNPISDPRFSRSLIVSATVALRANDSISYYFIQNLPVYPYLRGYFEDLENQRLLEGNDDLVNNYAATIFSASSYYQFLLKVFHVKNKTDKIVPVYLCGRNLLEPDYRKYSDFTKQITFRYACGKPGSFNTLSNNITFWAASGEGTLNHELFHEVIAFDFPKAPYWLNEGVASMFEESVFKFDKNAKHPVSDLDSVIILPNFREYYLLAFNDKFNRAITIEELVNPQAFDSEVVNSVKDAFDRYFCIYLCDRQWLVPFYLALRDAKLKIDPKTQLTLLSAISGKRIASLDDDWKNWLDNFGNSIIAMHIEHPLQINPTVAANLSVPVLQQSLQKQQQRPEMQQQQTQEGVPDKSGYHYFRESAFSKLASLSNREAENNPILIKVKKEVDDIKVYPFSAAMK